MKAAHDIYAETNPAFCAHAAVAFAAAHISLAEKGPEAPVLYLALPIALSGDLAATFDGTNKLTGLAEWVERRPQIQVGLRERVDASMDIVSEAIQFGCFAQVLKLDSDGRLKLGSKSIKKSAAAGLTEASNRVLKRAERLGYWFSTAGTTRSAFDILGLTV